jgi:Fe-S oxidoreductase
MVRPDDRGGGPRALLASATGAEVAEFVDRGRETGCCGAGDSFGLFFPADGRLVAETRLRDPAAARTGLVLTACSRCAAQLGAAAPEGMQVRDLGDYLAELGGGPDGGGGDRAQD